MRRTAAQQLSQLSRLPWAVADPVNHRIFIRNSAPCHVKIISAGSNQLLDREALVDRHGSAAALIVRRMQGNRQGNLQLLLSEAANLRHQAGRRQRNMALSDVQPLRRTDQSDKPQDIVIVIQRLAGSHQYNVGDALAGVLLHKQNLIENFAGRQASDQSAQTRCAELTAHSAAHLR